MQDLGLKIQAVFAGHFERFRDVVHAPAVEELAGIERSVGEELRAACARGVSAADLERFAASLRRIEEARRGLRRRFEFLDELVLDGV